MREMLDRGDFISKSAWLTGVVLAHGLVFAGLLNVWTKTVQPFMPTVIVGTLVEGRTPVAKADPAQTAARMARQDLPRTQPVALAAKPGQSRYENQPASARSQGGQHVSGDDKPENAGQSPASESLVLPKSEAKHLNNPKPVYPALSRRLGEQGNVRLSVLILADGKVGDVRLKQSSGYARLDQSAMQAVRRWQYVPAHRGGQPVDYWYIQTIIFSLES